MAQSNKNLNLYIQVYETVTNKPWHQDKRSYFGQTENIKKDVCPNFSEHIHVWEELEDWAEYRFEVYNKTYFEDVLVGYCEVKANILAEACGLGCGITTKLDREGKMVLGSLTTFVTKTNTGVLSLNLSGQIGKFLSQGRYRCIPRICKSWCKSYSPYIELYNAFDRMIYRSEKSTTGNWKPIYLNLGLINTNLKQNIRVALFTEEFKNRELGTCLIKLEDILENVANDQEKEKFKVFFDDKELKLFSFLKTSGLSHTSTGSPSIKLPLFSCSTHLNRLKRPSTRQGSIRKVEQCPIGQTPLDSSLILNQCNVHLTLSGKQQIEEDTAALDLFLSQHPLAHRANLNLSSLRNGSIEIDISDLKKDRVPKPGSISERQWTPPKNHKSSSSDSGYRKKTHSNRTLQSNERRKLLNRKLVSKSNSKTSSSSSPSLNGRESNRSFKNNSSFQSESPKFSLRMLFTNEIVSSLTENTS